MSHKRFPMVALIALMVIGLLVVGGSAIQRSAWSQGYMMGRLSASGDDGGVVPYAPYGYPGRHFDLSSLLCGVGPLFTIGLLLLLLVGVGKMLHFRAWKQAGGPPGEGWAKHWHRHHGHMPPWCWDREEPSEGETEGTEPDAQTGDAGPES